MAESLALLGVSDDLSRVAMHRVDVDTDGSCVRNGLTSPDPRTANDHRRDPWPLTDREGLDVPVGRWPWLTTTGWSRCRPGREEVQERVGYRAGRFLGLVVPAIDGPVAKGPG
jgi:hypothetical protein